jgi:hypothetical protein
MNMLVDGSASVTPDPIRIFSEHTFPIALSIVLLLAIFAGAKVFFDRFFKKWDDYHVRMDKVDLHMVANTSSNDALRGSVDKLTVTIQDRRVEEMRDELNGLKSTVDRAVTEMQEHRSIGRTPQVAMVGVSQMPHPTQHQPPPNSSPRAGSSPGNSCG